MSKGHPKKCPSCGELYGDGNEFNQDFPQNNPIAISVGVTTLGQLAERNSKKMGKELCQIKSEQDKTRVNQWDGKVPEGGTLMEKPANPKAPWWRDGQIEGVQKLDKPLNLKTIKDPKKFIETGETK